MSSRDPFEIRLQFIEHLQKLTASQQSIQVVVSFAMRHARQCSEDLWDCVLEQCGKSTLNHRINIMYFLDTLCDPMTSMAVPTTSSAGESSPYPALLAKYLQVLVDIVVPPEREGVLNLMSARQILESWRARRTVPSDLCEATLKRLDDRRTHPEKPSESIITNNASRKRPRHSLANFSRSDTLRRMDEDRERHKRLRERMWVVPMPRSAFAQSLGPAVAARHAVAKTGMTFSPGSPTTSGGPSPFTPASPSIHQVMQSSAVGDGEGSQGEGSVGGTDGAQSGQPQGIALDVEFEQAWEDGSELGEDDLNGFVEENRRADQPLHDLPTLAAVSERLSSVLGSSATTPIGVQQ